MTDFNTHLLGEALPHLVTKKWMRKLLWETNYSWLKKKYYIQRTLEGYVNRHYKVGRHPDEMLQKNISVGAKLTLLFYLFQVWICASTYEF